MHFDDEKSCKLQIELITAFEIDYLIYFPDY